jgi:ribosomal protein L11 methylase PrmA
LYYFIHKINHSTLYPSILLQHPKLEEMIAFPVSISYLYALLREKERQLQECQSQLLQCQSEFFQHEHLCTKPELTAKTWYGSSADQFDTIRDTGILLQYHAIENEQLPIRLKHYKTKSFNCKMKFRN